MTYWFLLNSPLIHAFHVISIINEFHSICYSFSLYSALKTLQIEVYYNKYNTNNDSHRFIEDENEIQIYPQEPLYVSFTSGFIASTIAVLIVQPFDFIKTRMQQNLHHKLRFSSYIQKVYQYENWRAFYTGMHLRIFYMAPIYGILTSLYEMQKRSDEKGGIVEV